LPLGDSSIMSALIRVVPPPAGDIAGIKPFDGIAQVADCLLVGMTDD
jgi:hypothetical protein